MAATIDRRWMRPRLIGNYRTDYTMRSVANYAGIWANTGKEVVYFAGLGLDGSQTYTTDIKPWFGGEIALSVGPLPPPKDLANGGTEAASRSGRSVSSRSRIRPAHRRTSTSCQPRQARRRPGRTTTAPN